MYAGPCETIPLAQLWISERYHLRLVSITGRSSLSIKIGRIGSTKKNILEDQGMQNVQLGYNSLRS